MKLVIQRVKNASVEVDGKIVGEIEKGFLVLIGIKVGDTKEQADYLVKKVCNLRVFTDENDKMNLALNDVVIHWSGDLSMLLLLVYVNGEYLATFHADYTKFAVKNIFHTSPK